MCAQKRPECEEAPVGMTCGGRPVRPDEILQAKRSSELSPADLIAADGVGAEEDEGLEEDLGFDEDDLFDEADEDEEEESAAERMLRIASDALEEVRWRRREARRNLPERASVAWFDHLLTEGIPKEKLAAIDLVFSDAWCANQVEKLIRDPDARVSEAYAERTYGIIDVALEMQEAAGVIESYELMEESDEDLLLTWLDMTPPEEEDDREDDAYDETPRELEVRPEREAEDAVRWRDAVTALNLMRSCVKWIDWWAWEPVTPREVPCRRQD